MWFIFFKIISKIYIPKVCKDNKKANNSLYKVFGDFLSVVIHPADIAHLPVAYMQSFIRFCHGAQCFTLAALLICSEVQQRRGAVLKLKTMKINEVSRGMLGLESSSRNPKI